LRGPWRILRLRIDVQRGSRLCRRTSSRQHRSCRQYCRPSGPGAPPMAATGAPVPPHRVVAGDKASAKLPRLGLSWDARPTFSPAPKFPIAHTGAEFLGRTPGIPVPWLLVWTSTYSPAFLDPTWRAVTHHKFTAPVKLLAAHCQADLGPKEYRPGTIEVDRIIAAVCPAAH
jgi:hypothetical protein